MNWKEEVRKAINNKANTIKNYSEVGFNTSQIFELVTELAKLACEEQKKICDEYCSLLKSDFMILNAPTVNFEEDG